MNYEQEYQYFYNKYYSKSEKLIKQSFIIEKAIKKNTDRYLNELSDYLYKKVSYLFDVIQYPSLKNLKQLFAERYRYYDEDQTNLIFANEIKTGFALINPNELPPNYTFDKLLKEIAIFSALEDIIHLLHKNRNLFALFYKLNDFSKFEIKEYKGISIEDTPLFIELNIIANPEHYTNTNESYFFLENDDDEKSKIHSLPIAIALLHEIGFFELEKIKKLSPTSLARVIAIIQQKDPSNKNINRAISGNIRVLNPDNKEDGFKFTSHKHAEKVKEILNQIKLGE